MGKGIVFEDEIKGMSETVVRMDERIKTIFSNVHDIKTDMKAIKGTVTDLNSCVKTNETGIATNSTNIQAHLDSHKRDLTIAGMIVAAVTFLFTKATGG
jgi:hypothetical protein